MDPCLQPQSIDRDCRATASGSFTWAAAWRPSIVLAPSHGFIRTAGQAGERFPDPESYADDVRGAWNAASPLAAFARVGGAGSVLCLRERRARAHLKRPRPFR